jgi:glycerol-3-phosphate acyltransferase PlsY
MVLATLLIVAAAYLLGSIPTGLLLMRLFRHQDIRQTGSGNIGATNVLRSGGKGLGAATFLIDMLKGCSAVWLGGWLGDMLMPQYSRYDAQALAALIAVLGHVFPVWLRFRGGKGVATGFGVFLAATPLAALAAISVFFVVLAISRYVSLASILGAGSFPLFAWWLSRIQFQGQRPPFFIAVECAVALLIILKHHQNIRRLFAGHCPLAAPPRRPPALALGAQPGVCPRDRRRRRKQALPARLSSAAGDRHHRRQRRRP